VPRRADVAVPFKFSERISQMCSIQWEKHIETLKKNVTWFFVGPYLLLT
jgi:hypothetical protein